MREPRSQSVNEALSAAMVRQGWVRVVGGVVLATLRGSAFPARALSDALRDAAREAGVAGEAADLNGGDGDRPRRGGGGVGIEIDAHGPRDCCG